MEVKYYGSFAKPSGYTDAARNYVYALQRQGVRVKYVPCVASSLGIDYREEIDSWYQPLISAMNEDYSEDRVNIVHLNPRYAIKFHWEHGQNILITTWETDRLPDDCVKNCNRFNLIIVPSEFVKKALVDSGVNKQIITVIPHLVDPEDFPQEHPYLDMKQDPDSPYTFYAIGSWTMRKNLQYLLRDFWSVEWPDMNVQLVLKVNPVTEISLKDNGTIGIQTVTVNLTDKIQTVKQWVTGGDDYKILASMRPLLNYATRQDIIDLHLKADCYVSYTRGEGFCLPALDAKLANNSIIATNWGAQTELLDDDDMRLIYTLEPAFAADTELYTPQQRWANPDPFHFRSILLSVKQAQLGRKKTQAEYQSNRAKWLSTHSVIDGSFTKTFIALIEELS